MKKPNNKYPNKIINSYMLVAIGLTILVAVKFATLMLGPKETNVTHINGRIERGPILDRNGRLLATQIRLQSLEAWPRNIRDPLTASRLLAPILQRDQSELYKDLTNQERSYIWVQRFLPSEQSEPIQDYINKGDLHGFRLLPEYKRYYPEKDLVSHFIGFTNIDNVGLDGIELGMNDWLAPNPDNINNTKKVIYGDKVYLSLDIETQYIIDKVVRRGFQENSADNVMAILMDAKTAEVLVYSSYPSYDPNRFNEYSPKVRQSLPISMAYEPGSVFKIFSMATFLDLGGISIDQIFDINTVYNPPDFQKYKIRPIKDLIEHAALSTTEVLIYSSNVGMSTASESVSNKELYNKLKLFGFGNTTSVPLPGESNGIIKAPEDWTIRSKPTISFGQEIGVSAMQMVQAATVFSNGGSLLKPITVKKVLSFEGEEKISYRRKHVRDVISPQVAKTMLLMMEQVVSSPNGTMHQAQIEGLRISGKSGTAQTINPETGSYDENAVISSVLAIFPTNDPQFILYIVLINPKGGVRYGGRIASPMVKEMIEELTNRYNLPLSDNRISRHNGELNKDSLYSGQRLVWDSARVPDLHGLSKKDLLPLLGEEKIKLQIYGSGHVTAQLPSPGTIITDNLLIEVQLE